jgi:L-fuculose-phosphate aldolase
MVAATDGNLSARTAGGSILVTRSGVSKGRMTAADILDVAADGTALSGGGRPSTELAMHLAVYRLRTDAGAVVHAHPVHATAFAVAGIPLDEDLLPEVIVALGSIPLAPYATPSTPEVPASLEPLLAAHDAILLANHGALTIGATVDDACMKMEKLEHAARIMLLTRFLGGGRRLSSEEIGRLAQVSQRSYGRDLTSLRKRQRK